MLIQRRPNYTRNPPFTGPLPILLSLDRPPPALPGEGVEKPPLPRSEAKWEGSAARPGEGSPRLALNAVPTTRRPNNTRNPRFTSPLPILLSLDRPPPALLGEGVEKPPLPRSKAKWEGSAARPGEGSPRVALNAVPTTRRPNNTPVPRFTGPLV